MAILVVLILTVISFKWHESSNELYIKKARVIDKVGFYSLLVIYVIINIILVNHATG